MKSYAYDIWFMTKLYTLEHVYCLVSKLCRESRLLVSNFMSQITLFWSHILTPKKLDCATKPTFVRSALVPNIKQCDIYTCTLGGLRSIRKLIYYWFSKCDCLHKVLWYILRTFYFVDYAVYLHSIAAPKMERLVSKTLNNDRIIGYNTVKYQ